MANFLSNYPNLREYAVFSGSTVPSTASGVSGGTFRGNVGGFGGFPGITGVTFLGGTYIAPGSTGLSLANEEYNTLYNYLTGLTGTTYSGRGYLGDGVTGLTGVTGITLFSPGVHIFPLGFSVLGNLTLTGITGDQYVFISRDQGFVFSTFGWTNGGVFPANITLTGGITPYNIFWVNMTLRESTGFYLQNTSVPGILVSNGIVSPIDSSVTGGIYSLSRFVADNSSVLAPQLLGLPCYVKGTKIKTPSGYVAIEDLCKGDEVFSIGDIEFPKLNLTTFRKSPIVWIGKCVLNNLNDETRPICIQKNALGDGPFEDLYVSPGHAIIIGGQQVVCARDLVNGSTIYRDNCNSVTYYHLELETYSAVVANGIMAESFLASEKHVFCEKKSNFSTVSVY